MARQPADHKPKAGRPEAASRLGTELSASPPNGMIDSHQYRPRPDVSYDMVEPSSFTGLAEQEGVMVRRKSLAARVCD
jgi:hypothetical protein